MSPSVNWRCNRDAEPKTLGCHALCRSELAGLKERVRHIQLLHLLALCWRLTFVLRLRDLFRPSDGFPVFGFSDCDVGHAVGGSSPMPVACLRRDPDNVTRMDFLTWTALLLHVADAGGDDQRLPQRMGMPGRARTGFEGHRAAADAGWEITLEQAINTYRAREVFCCALD